MNLFDNKEDKLTEQDVRIFKDIYINYFRFREFHQLFITSEQQPSLDILYNESNPIYSFSSYGRFVNSFMIDCDNYEHIIEIDKKDFPKIYAILGCLYKMGEKTFGTKLKSFL